MASAKTGTTPAPGLAWDWTAAALGAAYALPAALVVLDDLTLGLALSIGVLPAALVGLAPTRRGRLAIPVLGVLTGVSIVIGGLLTGVPALAVVAVALLAMASAALAARSRLGAIAMTLSLPMVGIGLSYPDRGEALAAAGLIIAGSLFACLVAMPWPEHGADAPRTGGPRRVPPGLGYGLRLGATGATAAAVGFLLDLEHVGWVCAAALLVMRPAAEMQRLRSVGRVLAVTAGALLAVAIVRLDPPDAWYAVAAVVVVACAAGTHGSRWYVAPAFTTLLVFLLLLYADPAQAGPRFVERALETALGVAIAYFFGLLLPAVSRPPPANGT